MYRKISNCSRISNRSPPPQTLKKLQFFDRSLQIGKPPIEAAGRIFEICQGPNFFLAENPLKIIGILKEQRPVVD